MGKMKRWLAAALAVVMICGLLPAQAIAVDTVGTESDTCVCSEACTAEKWNASCPVCSTDLSKCKLSGSGSTGDAPQEPAGEMPVENIVKQDENGRLRMYVTLLDGGAGVLSTTNPDRDAWVSGPIGFGNKVTVLVEFPALKEAALKDGIRDDVWYYLDLPWELVPVQTDVDGNPLVDPEEPVELFSSGDIQALGGIYSQGEGEGTTYRLKFRFMNVLDQVGIASSFQYNATINDNLAPNTVYDAVRFGSAEPISFKTGSQSGSVSCDYVLAYMTSVWDGGSYPSSDSPKTKINWSESVLYTGSGTPSLNTDLVLSLGDSYGKHGIVNTMPSYCSDCPFQITVTTTDGTQSQLTPRFSGFPGGTWHFFQGTPSETNGYIAAVNLADFEIGTFGSNGNSFIAKKVIVTFGKSDGSAVEGIQKWDIAFSTQVYHNIQTYGTSFSVYSTLENIRSDGSDLYYSWSNGRSFGSPQFSKDTTSCVSVGKAFKITSSGTYLPEAQKTSFTVKQADDPKFNGSHFYGYGGNYFSIHYYPTTDKDGNHYDYLGRAQYYVCGKAGRNGPLTDKNGVNGLFNSITIGGKTIDWTDDCFNQKYSDACTVEKMSSDLLSGQYYDPVLAYQIKQVIPDPSAKIRAFRSVDTSSSGKYYWVVFAPEFVKNARANVCSGWEGYTTSDLLENVYNNYTYTRKPGDWMIYVFNAPGQDVSFELTERLGDINRDSSTTNYNGGGVYNKLELDHGTSTSYVTDILLSSWGSSYNAVDSISAEQVTIQKDEDGKATSSSNWIQWTAEFDFSGYGNKFNDRFSRIYIKLPTTVSLEDNGTTAEGFGTGKLMCQTANGAWMEIGALPTRANGESDWKQSGLQKADGYALYYWNYGVLVSGLNNIQYLGKDEKLHLRFFTKVNSLHTASSSSAAAIECELALQLFSGDIVETCIVNGEEYYGCNGSSLLTFQVITKGGIAQPYITKSVSTYGYWDEDGRKYTQLMWQVDGTLISYNNNALPYFFSGVWTFSDSMKGSTVTLEDGTQLDIDPGKYTSLGSNTQPQASLMVYLNGSNIVFSQEDLASAINAPVTKWVSFYDSSSSSYYYPAITLTYSGNMETGFSLQMTGLKNVVHIHLTYLTMLDDLAFCNAIDPEDLTQLYYVNLKNTAFGGWVGQETPVASAEYKTKIVAALAVQKTATNIMNSLTTPSDVQAAKLNPWENGWDGKSSRYTVTATVGASPTDYLQITDHISQYAERPNWLENAAKTTYDAPANLAALAQSLKVDMDSLTITYQPPFNGTSTVIYENGAFSTGWAASTMTLGQDLDNLTLAQFPGALFQVMLKQTDREGNATPIQAGSTITITYDGKLDIDTPLSDGKTFRQSKYYHGGVMEIVNNVAAVRAYAAPGVQQLSGTVEDGELICTVDGGVTGKFLVDKKVGKAYSSQTTEDDKQTYHFWIAERTEQSGKDTPVVTLSDIVSSFSNDTNLKNLMDQGYSEEESRALLAKLDALLLDYTTVSNLAIHYNQDSPALTTEADTPCYQQSGAVSPVTDLEIASGKILNVTTDSKTAGCLFTVTLSNMGYGEVAAVTYDLEIDWRSFFNKAEAEGLLQNGKLFGKVEPEAGVVNRVSEAEEGYVSSSESKVEIAGMTVDKKLLYNGSGSGNANWQVSVNTGYINGSDSLTISDTVTLKAEKEAVVQAAASSISIDNVKLVLVGASELAIYEKGALTTAAQKAGWKPENLAVTVDGLTVSVVISDATGSLLKPDQTYRMTYSTVLDKNVYVTYLVDAGLTLDQAEYTLDNKAEAKIGSFSASAESSATQEPSAPIGLDKSGARSQEEPTSILWKLSAKAGDADRQNVVIRDCLRENWIQLFLPHTSFAWMTITLQSENGSVVEVFNNKDGQSVDRLAEFGAKLEAISALDGEAEGDFAFGVDGQTGFALSFETLAKNTTVNVTYKTMLNVRAYEIDRENIFWIYNDARITTADGSICYSGASCSIFTPKMMEKCGWSSCSSDGVCRQSWRISFDLRSKYTLEELKNVKSVVMVDELHPGLSYIAGSLKVYQQIINSSWVSRGSELPADTYQLELDGNRLIVRMLKPAEYPTVEVDFSTEARASFAGFTNVAYLYVDGIAYRSETPIQPVTAVGQTGYITSIHAPEWTPQIYKYLDGADKMDAGAFSFTLTEVTKDGDPIPGAASITATNNEKGEILFDTIHYTTVAENGEEHYYEIAETDLAGYQEDVPKIRVWVLITRLTDSYQVSVTNLTETEGDPFTFYNSTLVEIKGQKVWDDKENQDGKRPDHVTVYLYADGKEIDHLDVTAGEDGNWNWSFGSLPRTVFGKAIQYSVLEKAVDGYTTEITGNAEDGFTITNSYTPSKTGLTVTKIWEDGDDQDGIRPTEVTVKLFADGKDTGKTLTLKAAENWTGSFTDLDEYAAGKKIVYTVEEVTVDGYTFSVAYDPEKSSASITNVHEPAKINISGEKVWDDGNDQDGIRPEWIIVKLMKDGKLFASTVATKDDNWTWSFQDLDKFADGQPIEYTVIEEAVEGYTTEIVGNAEDGFTITNTHTPSKTSLTVTKVWEDANNQDGIRPAEVTVKLLANGKDTGKTLILKAAENWTGSFTDLDEYAAGVKIVYTVEEAAVDGYTAAITGSAEDGFTVTNTHTPFAPVSVEITAEKTLDGKTPAENCFSFLLTDKDGNVIQTVKNVGGKITFAPLQFSKAGVYVYTLTEQAGNQSGIVYDTAAYTVTITVTVGGKGIIAVTAYQKDGKEYTGTPLFANTTKKLPDAPQTGDGYQMGLGIYLIIVSTLGFAATLLAGKKRYRGKYAVK